MEDKATIAAVVRLLVAALALTLAACRTEPYAIGYGTEECAYCRMVIADPRYAAELVTRQGKVYTFDSVECLAGFYAAGSIPVSDVHSLWVTDFAKPRTLIPAPKALYLKMARLRSTMGRNLAAVSERRELEDLQARYGGTEMSWQQVLSMIRESPAASPRAGHPPLPSTAPAH